MNICVEPVLYLLAAVGLAVIMAGDAYLHLSRREAQQTVFTA